MNKQVYPLRPSRKPPSATKRLKVAAYARVSTDSDEQAESLETQKSHYEHFIGARVDWELAGIYFDEGISGTKKENRTGLNNLLADCRAGRVERILTKSISRFARNTTDCLEMVRELQGLGVSIYFEKENIDTDSMESELFLTLLSSMAEEESRAISQNNKWSIQKRFEQGSYKLSSPPYGYLWDGQTLVPHPDQAKIVREIFALRLTGMGTSSIAKHLNRQGIYGQRGGRWSSTTICGILQNEKYTGDALLQKSYTDEYFKRHKNRGAKAQYLLTDHHEPIIDRKTFDQVQLLIKQRRAEKGIETGSKKYTNHYLFTNRLVCGCCGSGLKRQTRKTKAGPVIYWCCSQHIRDIDACPLKAVAETRIQRAFVIMVKKLEYGAKQIIKPYLEALKSAHGQLDLQALLHLQTQIDTLKCKKESLQELYTEGLIDLPLFRQESAKLDLEEESAQKRLDQLENGQSDQLGHLEETQVLWRLLKNEIAPDTFNETLFDRLVDHVEIKDVNTACFHLKAGLNLNERM